MNAKISSRARILVAAGILAFAAGEFVQGVRASALSDRIFFLLNGIWVSGFVIFLLIFERQRRLASWFCLFSVLIAFANEVYRVRIGAERWFDWLYLAFITAIVFGYLLPFFVKEARARR